MSELDKKMRRVRKLARTKLGIEDLHPGQVEALKAILSGRDTLAVMPTGSGKSAVYQLAAQTLPGPTVIISPLIALQHDQTASIADHHLGEAAEVNTTIGAGERREALEELEERELEYLFLAPEQFNNDEILARLRDAKPSLLVVDEAHVVSEWGHDFRPEYLRVGAVADALGHPTILALTATSSPRVRPEIVERLHLREPAIIVRGFDRPNISLAVERFHDEAVKRDALLERVQASETPGIVYVATHRHVDDLIDGLRERGVSAVGYHGGMSAKRRGEAQDAFMNGEADVIVATNAFGMGIDKPDVRFVYHYDIPDSVDSYFQEIGRGGRDGEPAEAVLFYRPADLGLHRFFAGGGKVDEEQMETVARALDRHRGALSLAELREETGLSQAKLSTAVTSLEDAGAVETTATGEVETVPRRKAEKASHAAVEAEERLRAFEQSRLEMMRGYAETGACRREYILNYFGEVPETKCAGCDVCESGPTTVQGNHPFPLRGMVRHGVWGEGVVERYDDGTMVVLFDSVGYKTLAVDFVVESGALELL